MVEKQVQQTASHMTVLSTPNWDDQQPPGRFNDLNPIGSVRQFEFTRIPGGSFQRTAKTRYAGDLLP